MAFGGWVQGTSKDAGSTTSTTLAYTGNVVAGNTLLIAVRHGGSVDDTTVSDNLNGTWTKDKTLAVTSAGVLQTWRFSNTLGGACTVTVAFTTAATMRFVIDEYTGNFGLDAASTIVQGNSNAPTSGSVTTTHTCAIIGHHIGGANVAGQTAVVAGSGFTIREKIDNATPATYVASEDMSTTQVAGSYLANLTQNLADTWGMDIVAYYDASAAPEASYDPARSTPFGMIPPTGFLRDTYSYIEAPVVVNAPLVWAPVNLGTIRRRLMRAPPARRAEPVPPQFNPPIPFAAIHPTRQLRGWPVRRGRQATPIPPQFNPPLPLRPVQARVWRGWPVRRGRAVTPVPPQVNPPIIFNLPQHRLWATLTRRGRAVSPIPPQFNPPLTPARLMQRRPLATLLRRGHQVTPVPSQQALPVNPPYATIGEQHRLWAWFLRRGKAVTPAPTQPDIPLRRRLQHGRLTPPLARRGRSTPPVPTQPDIPLRRRLRHGRLTPPLARRGRQATPPLAAPAVPNPPYPTKALSVRRLAGWLFRRGRKAERGWPQDVDVATAPTITYPTSFPVVPSTLGLDGVLGDTRLELQAGDTGFTLISGGTDIVLTDENTWTQ